MCNITINQMCGSDYRADRDVTVSIEDSIVTVVPVNFSSSFDAGTRYVGIIWPQSDVSVDASNIVYRADGMDVPILGKAGMTSAKLSYLAIPTK